MLELDTRGGTATLALSRPERGNALSAELVEALIAATRDAFADPAIHTLVLRAQGRHFCTGLDLSELAQLGDGDLLQRVVRIETLLAAMWNAPIRPLAQAGGTHRSGPGAPLCDGGLVLRCRTGPTCRPGQ
jgi:enoyl-CoA hydratase/carnithine racemase